MCSQVAARRYRDLGSKEWLSHEPASEAQESAGDIHRDVGAAGQTDEQVDVVWIAGNDGYCTDAAALLGYRDDLCIGRRDVVARQLQRLGAQHTSPGGSHDGQGSVDVLLGAYGLDQAIDERIGTAVTRADLSEDRNGNQERPIESLLKQFEIGEEQVSAGGQRADTTAVEQEVAAMATGHSGQVSARD